WLRPDGNEMTQDEWNAGWVRCFGLWLNGLTLDEVNAIGEPIHDDTFLLLFNAHHEPMRFVLPPSRPGTVWELCFDTRSSGIPQRKLRSRKAYSLSDRSMVLLIETPETTER